MAGKLTPEAVKAEVKRFWDAFMAKTAEQIADFYAPHASVFGSSSTRPEPGRLAATRRQREYFHDRATINASTGPVDVVMLSDHAAVASYNFQFHATQVAATNSKGAVEESIQHGRATQVFALEPDGKVRIVHEHFSNPMKL